MKFILGKKIGMTQIWKNNKLVGATQLEVAPCFVSQIKTQEKDGYWAVQIGKEVKKEKSMNKAQKGHLAKIKVLNPEAQTNLSYLKEFRLSEEEIKNLNLGDKISIDSFVEGDKVKVSAISKGKGYQGVVKRHGFAGAPKSHGTKDQLRMPGSIGCTGPQRVIKGLRMAGRMGGVMMSSKNLKVVSIDSENNILLVKGALPGAKNGLVSIITNY